MFTVAFFHSCLSVISMKLVDFAANSLDEYFHEFLSAEAASHGQPKKVLIVDARSYAAAVGNRARGGGVECAEYYPNAEIHFMNLVNIHSIRKSFQSVRSLCTNPGDQTSWFQVSCSS